MILLHFCSTFSPFVLIPKQLIDKPGLGPPTDRRVIYLTVRNLLEIPLPKWADENHGKHDMDDHNQEGKCDGISPVAFKTDRNHNSINTNTPDGKTGNKRKHFYYSSSISLQKS
jgi:hypothetical protein